MTTNEELWSRYFQPTPKRMKRLAIAIRAFCTVISGSAIGSVLSAEEPNKMFLWIALTSVLLQALSEFIINFFTLEEPTSNEIKSNKP